jgi:hypothetical protein
VKNSEDNKKELVDLLKKIEEQPQNTNVKLNDEQAKQLARIIKKLLKQQLH